MDLSWRGHRRRRRSEPASVTVALGVVVVLLLGAIGGGLQAGPRAEAALSVAASDLSNLFGWDSLEGAERSLALGGGPAGGVPLNCTVSGSSLSGECNASATTPDAPHLGEYWQSYTQPSGRTLMSVAWDPTDGYTVAFGGWNGTTYFNDTWEYLHGSWAPLSPRDSPSARAGAAMAYQPSDHYVMLFGGYNGKYYLNDTWRYTDDTWTRLDPTLAPPARAGAAIVYDARDGYTLLFGGGNSLETFSDTWQYHNGAWTALSPGGYAGTRAEAPSQTQNQSALPLGREDASIAFDTALNVVILFGGVNLSGGSERFLNDTWSFAGDEWTSLNLAHAPPARAFAAFGYDSADNESVLFGGVNPTLSVQYNDTWTFAGGGVWTHLLTTISPSAREGAAGFWDPTNGNFTVFSGVEGGLPTANPDTWNFLRGAWHVDRRSMALSWPNPSARYAASMAWDPLTNVTLLFGGMVGFGTVGTYQASNETWIWWGGNSSWQQLFPPESPPARSFASMVFDYTDREIVLFGGRAADGAALNDTWRFHENVWTQLPEPTAPSPRYGAAMAFDNATTDRYVILYGGVDGTGADLSDTWIFTAQTWTLLATSTSPGPRGFAEASYDATIGYPVLYGGLRGTQVLGDWWEYLHGAWTNLTTSSAPPARWGAVFSFVPAHQLVLIGGCGQAVDPVAMQCNDLFNDTWNLYAPTTWKEFTRTNSSLGYPDLGTAEAEFGFESLQDSFDLLIQSGLVNVSGQIELTNERFTYAGNYEPFFPPVIPSAREGAAGAYYGASNEVIMVFGGLGVLPDGRVGYLNDTWQQDTNVWYPATPRNSPSARAFGAMAFDAASRQVVYFGGYGPNGYLGGTWAWLGGPITGDWHQIVTANAPTPRANESLAYDLSPFDVSPAGYLVLFGGQNGTGAGSFYGDTWIYQGSSNANGSVVTGNWTELSLTTAPSPRAAAAMAYDITDGYIVLFGGHDSTTTFGDTWEFVSGAWRNVSSSVGLAPPARYGASMVDDHWDAFDYRNTSGLLPNVCAVLVGGVGASGNYLPDTWGFAGGVWVNVTLHDGALPPPPAAFSAIADDEDDGNVVVFGGEGPNGGVLDGFFTFF